MGSLRIFDPTIREEEKQIDFAPRPATLHNLCVGLVDNAKFNSDRLLLKIAAILEKDYGAKGHIIRRKHNAGVPAHDDIINEFIEKCDVVVAGVGD